MNFRLVMLTTDEESNEEQIKPYLFAVKPGALVYLGAQGVSIEARPGWFRQGELSIGLIERPTEKEVLQKLLPALEGTPWEQPVKVRIAALD